MQTAYVPRQTPYTLAPEDALNDLRMSEAVRPLYDHVKKFIAETVEPMQHEFDIAEAKNPNRWSFSQEQLDLLGKAKAKAKEEGLWNFFLPDAETGEGLSNLDYAYIAVELGKAPLASEVMNCSAPDTGNMEVLERVGTPEQKEKWLKPLLNGEIRSAYVMTEPNVASSDAKNVSTSAVLDGNEWVINGEKYYISGLGDPRCKIMIVMVKTDPTAAPSKQQSQILVPVDTPGVEVLGPMHVFGHDHAPRGHMHMRFNNVRVPKENILLGEGRGFEISQLRLGPGRIHHCMRTIGKAEKALDLMVARGLTREAFGKKLAHLGGNMQIIAQARCEIEAMRLMVLKAAKAMDVLGNKEARVWVSMVKAMVPERACKIIDQAIQMHGATGISQWTPLAEMYTDVRHLRFADGPDEVHWMVVGRHELTL
ncbi:acyl-CoA dehydrogenase family protein [Rhodopseudomonas sp. P1]|uniref:Acyl-CoA dehydrogenase family protein n=1 Tax=Rhodopseudomonas palustris TaxID=1076 RepID=A0AAX3DXM0_RHOPL|nr:MULTISPECIES: acyl-CoA dehydrogenase family protein [Rhodopseudomonas]MCD0421240.1 acyl-CoA dehydrogenase family protein [Rubrivivax sp. JA1024]AVT82905.1 acyl-CoA dehydrogenase [Rhodopseudomonas palustris]NEW90494.1 acyl-CoA dehydrogenase [Rhodopseudomonas sp. BR0M22]UYO38991.1 acyl-CoA dehydrogenase family protein [Rhodopseudomonas palustris]UYO48343.1 acyl-CoA dehydrogenase family protein [Rhodopseudomonas palustris]